MKSSAEIPLRRYSLCETRHDMRKKMRMHNIGGDPAFRGVELDLPEWFAFEEVYVFADGTLEGAFEYLEDLNSVSKCFRLTFSSEGQSRCESVGLILPSHTKLPCESVLLEIAKSNVKKNTILSVDHWAVKAHCETHLPSEIEFPSGELLSKITRHGSCLPLIVGNGNYFMEDLLAGCVLIISYRKAWVRIQQFIVRRGGGTCELLKL